MQLTQPISSITSYTYYRSKQMTGPLATIIALEGNSLPDVSDVDHIRGDNPHQKSEARK